MAEMRSDLGVTRGGRSGRGLRRLGDLTPRSVLIVAVFAAMPLVWFLNENRLELVQIGRMTVWVVSAVAVALFGLAVVMIATREVAAERLAVTVAVAAYSFFSFDLLFDANSSGSRAGLQALLWVVLTAVISLLVFRLAAHGWFFDFAFLFGIVLLAIPAGSYLVWRAAHDPGAVGAEVASSPLGAAVDLAARPDDLPNIYVFVFDERARVDQLEEVYDIDTTEFESQLIGSGFSVSPTSFSSYYNTILSLSSLLDMDYPATEAHQVEDGIIGYADALQGHNRTVETLTGLGYTFIYADSGAFDWARCDAAVAVCLEAEVTGGLDVTEFDGVLLEMTPLGLLVGSAPTDPRLAMESFKERREEVDDPFLLLAHVLSPHEPFRFDDECGRLSDQFAPADRRSAEAGAAYAREIRCMDIITLAVVSDIVETDPTAIVALVSDHGSSFISHPHVLLESWSAEALRERLAVLDAVRAPGCEVPQEPGALVNLFPILIECATDGLIAIERQDDRAFFWHEGRSPYLEEIESPDQLLAPSG